MRIPTEKEFMKKINEKLTNWLLTECIEQFGEEEIKNRGKNETLEEFLAKRGYRLENKQFGNTISCSLLKGEKRVSYINVNMKSVAKEFMNG